MLTSFADNSYLTDYVNLIYKYYVTQNASVLCNYYSISTESSFSRNFSTYSEKDTNIKYNNYIFYPTYFGTTSQPTSQSGDNVVPQYSNDQIDIVLHSHITPQIGDKVVFSTEINKLLERNNNVVFVVTSISLDSPSFDIRSVYKLTLQRSTLLRESDLQKQTLNNYVHICTSNKFIDLKFYDAYVYMLFYLNKLTKEFNKRYLNNYVRVNNISNEVVLEIKNIFSFLIEYLKIDFNTFNGLFREININLIGSHNKVSDTGIEFNIVSNIDLNFLRKYPYITKHSKFFIPKLNNNYIGILDTDNLFTKSILDSATIIANINEIAVKDEIYKVSMALIKLLDNTDFNVLTSLDIILLLLFFTKLEDMLLDDYD